MFAVLHLENYVFTADEAAVYNFTIDISTGKIKFDEIVSWLKKNTKEADK